VVRDASRRAKTRNHWRDLVSLDPIMNSFHPSNPLRPSAPIASSSRRAKLIIKHPHSPLHFPPDVSVDLSKVRAYAACRNCRIKKIKCLPGESDLANAGPPGSCQQCVQAGIECTYPPTRDRAAYSRQYVQNLEARVQALEMVQGRMMPLLDAFERGEGEPSRVGRPQRQSRPAVGLEEGEGEQSIRGGVQRSPSQDAEDLGQITFDERGNSRWIGSSNTLSLLGSFSHRSPADPSPPSTSTPHDANPYFGPVAGSGVVKALPGIDEVSYPSARAAAEMVDAFFAEVHPCLPIMAEHEFREGFRRLMELRASHQPQESSGVSHVIVVLACAKASPVHLCGLRGLCSWGKGHCRIPSLAKGASEVAGENNRFEAGDDPAWRSRGRCHLV